MSNLFTYTVLPNSSLCNALNFPFILSNMGAWVLPCPFYFQTIPLLQSKWPCVTPMQNNRQTYHFTCPWSYTFWKMGLNDIRFGITQEWTFPERISLIIPIRSSILFTIVVPRAIHFKMFSNYLLHIVNFINIMTNQFWILSMYIV
jgi:hypothetical protein